MNFKNKTLIVVLGIVFIFALLGFFHVGEFALDAFGYGLVAGFLLSILIDRLGFLKQPGEYHNDLERVLDHFYTTCFVTKDMSEEHTQALIESIETRIKEFKVNLERRIKK